MDDWYRNSAPQHDDSTADPGVFGLIPAVDTDRTSGAPAPSFVTGAGAEWLASASVLPASVHALWHHRPTSPRTLPCGSAFDVVSTAPLPGRRLLERLWSTGPGSGPVAVHRGRLLLFASPGTAQRLPALLSWGEWSAETFPSLLCHGPGDYVTVPALTRPLPDASDPQVTAATTAAQDNGIGRHSRWLVAPDLRHPWLPGPEVLLRACLGTGRTARSPRCEPSVRAGRGPRTAGQSISAAADRDAKVYDVTRRR